MANNDYGDGATRTVETSYHPEYGEYLIDPETMEEDAASTFVMPGRDDPWVLTTFTEARVTANGQTAITEMCFDRATGFLERRRVLAGSTPADGDLLTVFVEEEVGGVGTGRVASQLSYGGDPQGPMDKVYDDLCEMTLTGLAVQYRMDHSYSHGSLAKSDFVDPCDGTSIVTVADHDIDASTGLVATSRDSAGVATSLLYDSVGRLTSERPAGTAWTHYRYQLPTIAQPNLAVQLTVEQCSNGLATCSGADLLGWRRHGYDGLGRMVQEMLRYPGLAGIVEESRWMTYNAMGWKATESAWGNAELVTTFSLFDRFGRVGKIQPPGSNPASEISYTT
ncbi:MAG: hypothetical protein GY856_27815 [bacterium]|nr:hypothetical protein [bacterium]